MSICLWNEIRLERLHNMYIAKFTSVVTVIWLGSRSLSLSLSQLLGKEEEGSEESSEEESSEYSEETDSEEEGPRLKPVFVRRKDRVTIHQKEQEQAKVKQVRQNNGIKPGSSNSYRSLCLHANAYRIKCRYIFLIYSFLRLHCFVSPNIFVSEVTHISYSSKK